MIQIQYIYMASLQRLPGLDYFGSDTAVVVQCADFDGGWTG